MNKDMREKLKTTITGLSLMLVIGGLGGYGSYAYFTDQAQINNDLVVNMGSFKTTTKDVNVSDIDITKDLANPKLHTGEFELSNLGSLDQYVKLELVVPQTSTNMSKEDYDALLNCLKYQIVFDEDTIKSMPQERKGLDKFLYSGGELGYLTDTNGDKVVLKSGETITGDISIMLHDVDEDDKNIFSGKTITVELVGESKQINDPSVKEVN